MFSIRGTELLSFAVFIRNITLFFGLRKSTYIRKQTSKFRDIIVWNFLSRRLHFTDSSDSYCSYNDNIIVKRLKQITSKSSLQCQWCTLEQITFIIRLGDFCGSLARLLFLKTDFFHGNFPVLCVLCTTYYTI